MKQQIRLTESELRHIISESVKKIISEVSFEKAHAAALSAVDPKRRMSPAMQRRMARDGWGASAEQALNLKKGAVNSFNREYGKNLADVPYGDADTSYRKKYNQKPSYGMRGDSHLRTYATYEDGPYNHSAVTNNYRPDYNPSSNLGYDTYWENEYKYYPKAGKRGDDALKNSFNKWHDNYYGYEDD